MDIHRPFLLLSIHRTACFCGPETYSTFLDVQRFLPKHDLCILNTAALFKPLKFLGGFHHRRDTETEKVLREEPDIVHPRGDLIA